MTDSKQDRLRKQVKPPSKHPERSDAPGPRATPIARQDVAEYKLDLPHPTTTDERDLTDRKIRRRAALSETFGLFKGKGVFPLDGLEFEREMREEW